MWFSSSQMQHVDVFFRLLSLSVFSLSFTLHFTYQPPLTTLLSVWSFIHLQTLFPHEQSISLLCANRMLSFHASLSPSSAANILFSAPSGKISRAFTPLPTLPSFSLCLILFYILSARTETEPSHQAEATAADAARPQTSASHVPPQLYSADQTNR